MAFLSSLPLLGSIFYTPAFAAAEPALNMTALHTIVSKPWVDEPSGRGTWGLLHSCSFTLLLCVYTAIHLNVPAYYDKEPAIWLRKAKWVGIAIFGPEIVVYAAFEQWFLARKFLRELKVIADESKDPDFRKWYDGDPKNPPFNMAYAHYVLMGGLVSKIEDIHNTLKKMTFHTSGILCLARHGYFCRLTRSDIIDKSKADSLAKSLVYIQVLWVVGQAVERKLSGFPITILEIHTIVHVICALFMYLLWFQKPLNVHSPTILDLGLEHSDLLAAGLQIWCQNGSDLSKQDRPRSECQGFSFESPFEPEDSKFYHGPAFSCLECWEALYDCHAKSPVRWINHKS
ncbi:hypothetical protein VTL71DRAFT_13195 [Oculimacula yallundae]|uniref:Polyprenol reductase n=1 Tax=Oculimacula yallundae TaxID=86028 RepID=A0ABR4CK85_9HELO